MLSWRNSGLARIVAWSVAILLTVLSIVPPDLRPETPLPHYVEHFVAYAVMGAAFGYGDERRPTLLVLYLVIFCAVIEALQLLAPGRHARLSDFITDAIAVCAGVAVVSLTKKFHSRRTARLGWRAAKPR